MNRHERPAQLGLRSGIDSASEWHQSESRFDTRTKIAQRYEIITCLGKGGMGEVWRAYDVKLRVDVALKSCALGSIESTRPIEDLVETLRSEVRIAREVISPNVCRIYDLVVDGNQELISMEFIDGITLLELLIQKGPLNLRESCDIAAQFLAGLEAIHHAGLVHRDMKPENIMITRTGRVVVMDFGIAKHIANVDESISGTLPYMSPEQLAGENLDARSDVFAAGVVLAEMVHPEGIVTEQTRQGIWNLVRREPLKLPDSPWKSVIAQAVSSNLQDRFPSAGALARALEEATQRIEITDDRKPYPGLASFDLGDSDYFFGREFEVEVLIKKIQQLHLLALIGPSGAGKTSLLRAGLIPNLPESWGCILTQPGDTPLINLAQALEPEEHFEDFEVALSSLHRWRQNYPEALLIVDRFEELFTLNTPQIQARFAELIGNCVMEADIRVLLVMRDDFLIFCKEHHALSPIFSELTAMLPLNGASLRRALVQPALKCGYRFEDEKLVDDILADLEKDRGALPLMAFAASRLWEKRDRESGILTRSGYLEIGGVAGALAQHADATIEHIGSERLPIVREIFRNLITAQGTRVARDTKELLSIFHNHKEAEEVLRALIDARLLTSFEAPTSRVEIIHESLLSTWPLLVRWQTQDADSVQLRDQLRQASQLWEQRNRSHDLLWTGAAFLEFQAWRQRYPGGLTATEGAFAQAMSYRANKQRRQRRLFLSTTFIVLLSVLAGVSILWRQSTVAKNDAISQAKTAQASKILTLGKSLPNADSSTKLAYAIASLELSSSPEARHFALQALATAPPAIMQDIPTKPMNSIELSPDGKWMAVGVKGGLQLYPRDGKTPITVNQPYAANVFIPWSSQFSADGKFLIWTMRQDTRIVKVWSIAEMKVIRTFNLEGTTIVLVRGGNAYFITDATGSRELPASWSNTLIRKWNFSSSEPIIMTRLQFDRIWWNSFDIDHGGRWFAYARGKNVHVSPLNAAGPEKIFGPHPTGGSDVKFRPNSDELASTDVNGLIQIWSLNSGTKTPIRTMNLNGEVGYIWFDPEGRHIIASRDGQLYRWDLNAPKDTDPLIFQFPGPASFVTFDIKHQWMIAGDTKAIAYFDLKNPYPYILRGTGFVGSRDVRFTPDGQSLLNGFRDDASGVLRWNLPGQKQLSSRDFWNRKENITTMDVDPLQRFVLAGALSGKVHLISFADQTSVALGGPDAYAQDVEFSKDGKHVAAALDESGENCGIYVWELASSNSWILEQSKGKSFYSLEYSGDNSIFAGDFDGNLYQWDSVKSAPKILRKGKGIVSGLSLSPDNKRLAVSIWSANAWNKLEFATSELFLLDLKNGKSVPITSHGSRVFSVGFDPTGATLVTGDMDGTVRVGPLSGKGVPHLMLGHETRVNSVAVHPSGEWIASTEARRPTVRLWRMPRGNSIASISDRDFLDRLKKLTNVRIVPDKNSSNGYKIQYSPFPGLEKVPN